MSELQNMSELQIGLLIVGAVVIACVFLFNRWQERKYRKQAEQMFKAAHPDALFESPGAQPGGVERVEPSLETLPGVPDAAREPAFRTAPSAQGVQSAADAYSAPLHAAAEGEEPATAQAPLAVIDPAIDFVAVVKAAEGIPPEALKKLMARARSVGKPVHWEGLCEGYWEPADPGRAAHYTELKAGLQLANRRGALNEEEIANFVAMIRQFAQEIHGTAQCEPQDSAAQRAAGLDEFCASVDVELAVNVFSRNAAPFPATKVRALAEAAGMRLMPDGVFHYIDEDGAHLFSLRNADPRPFLPDQVKHITTRGVTLALDVPRVANGTRAFDQMLELARHIADNLGGEVVDDNHKPLTETGVASIRRQLSEIYRQMEDSGIAAGSPLALRLFS